MKILFAMRHAGYVRNFESTLRMLCERGHHVHLAFQGKVKYPQLDPTDIARQLSDAYPNFSSGSIPLRSDGWGLLGRELRLGLDYLRYLTPEYDEAPKLRERATREAPEAVLMRSRHGFTSTRPGRRLLAAWLRAMDQAIHRDPEVDAYMRRMRPDVLAVTPLIEPGSPQVEYVRSARSLGIPTALCVASWDNLTNKGLIHGPVDLVTVWNDAMKREAVELHRISPARVVVTGAAAFDHWFDWKASTSRSEFCARVGLPADRPYLLYLCSSKFVAPNEASFIRKWVEQIRQSSFSTLREIGILVRPHPQNAEQWQSTDLSDCGPVAVWPRCGAAPVDSTTRSQYFDSMFHSAAVVGVNTTAEIESAILGRPVCTLLAPEFRDTQGGTLHFHHLREINGGLVTVAHDFHEHLAQLDAVIQQPEPARLRCQKFVEAFVRPQGLEVPATAKLVDALEQLSRARRPALRPVVWAGLVRGRLERRAAALEREARVQQEARAARRASRAAREAKQQARLAEREAKRAEKARLEEERRVQRAAEEKIAAQQKVENLVTAFRGLGHVRRRTVLTALMGDIPPNSFIELHANTPPRKLDYEHADIYMRVTTKGEEFRIRACAKEPFTIDWIHQRIAAGEVLYDIGANVGAYSLVAAKKPGGGARVFSFEASYATVASLCANVALNHLDDQVTPMPVALSDTTALNVFSLRDLEPGAARHALGYEPPEDGPTLYQQPVMMFRLDDLVDWFGLPPPNHIKLDVDGGELAVLEGASRALGSPALRSMLVEVATSLSGPVSEVLERHGLRLESKVSVKSKSGEYAVWYGLFVRDGAGAAAGNGHQPSEVTR
jgi:FkbM family methyltransferase